MDPSRRSEKHMSTDSLPSMPLLFDPTARLTTIDSLPSDFSHMNECAIEAIAMPLGKVLSQALRDELRVAFEEAAMKLGSQLRMDLQTDVVRFGTHGVQPRRNESDDQESSAPLHQRDGNDDVRSSGTFDSMTGVQPPSIESTPSSSLIVSSRFSRLRRQEVGVNLGSQSQMDLQTDDVRFGTRGVQPRRNDSDGQESSAPLHHHDRNDDGGTFDSMTDVQPPSTDLTPNNSLNVSSRFSRRRRIPCLSNRPAAPTNAPEEAAPLITIPSPTQHLAEAATCPELPSLNTTSTARVQSVPKPNDSNPCDGASSGQPRSGADASEMLSSFRGNVARLLPVPEPNYINPLDVASSGQSRNGADASEMPSSFKGPGMAQTWGDLPCLGVDHKNFAQEPESILTGQSDMLGKAVVNDANQPSLKCSAAHGQAQSLRDQISADASADGATNSPRPCRKNNRSSSDSTHITRLVIEPSRPRARKNGIRGQTRAPALERREFTSESFEDVVRHLDAHLLAQEALVVKDRKLDIPKPSSDKSIVKDRKLDIPKPSSDKSSPSPCQMGLARGESPADSDDLADIILEPANASDAAMADSKFNNAESSEGKSATQDFEGPGYSTEMPSRDNERPPSECARQTIFRSKRAFPYCCLVSTSALPFISGVRPWSIPRGSVSTLYQWLVMLIACSCSVFLSIKVVAGVEEDDLRPSLLLMAIFSSGATLGLWSCRVLSRSRELCSCVDLITAYADKYGFKERWQYATRKNSVIGVSLLVISILAHWLWSPWEPISWMLMNCVFTILAILHSGITSLVVDICCGMVMVIDEFCAGVICRSDLSVAMHDWNVIRALCGTTSRAIQLIFIVTQTCAAMVALLSVTGWSSRSLSLLEGIPWLVLSFSSARISTAVASVSNRCARASILMNSVPRNQDFDEERMYMVEYIAHSQAGIYVFDVRVCSGLIAKALYITCAVAFAAARK